MREIKFRGLEVSTGSWVVGSHVKTGADLHYIVPQNVIGSYMPEYHVKKETVGQFTGLHDKNGKEIYEGDILKVPDLYETPENTYPTYHYEKVIYDNHGFGTDNAMFYEDGDYISEECEVMGNIYENPELMEQTS